MNARDASASKVTGELAAERAEEAAAEAGIEVEGEGEVEEVEERKNPDWYTDEQ